MDKQEPVDEIRLFYLANKLKQARGQEDNYQLLRDYFSHVAHHQVKVHYSHGAGWDKANVGRVYAKGGHSYQGMPKDLRNFLCKDIGHDIDIVNAEPTLLSQLAKMHQFNTPCLDRYVRERNTVLEAMATDFGVAQADAKELMLRLIHLGGIDNWKAEKNASITSGPTMDYVEAFHAEMASLAAKLCIKYPQIVDVVRQVKGEATGNAVISSAVAMIYQTEEHKVLMCIDTTLKTQGRKLCSYIFDGGIVPKLPPAETELPADILRKCEDAVHASLGYHIKLVQKPMTSSYEHEFQRSPWYQLGCAPSNTPWPIPFAQTDAMLQDDADIRMPYCIKKRLFEAYHAKVMNPICYITMVPGANVLVRTRTDFLNAYEHLHCTTIDGKQAPLVPEWIKDTNIRRYTTLDFVPPPRTCPDGTYNMWKGFAAERNGGDPSLGDVDPFLGHLSIVCNHDPRCIKYLTSYLAQMIQCPGVIPGTAFVLISSEGAGKNSLLYMIREVIGQDMFFETSDPARDIFGQFSNGRLNKLLVNMDEVGRKDTMPFSDKLKSLITSQTFNYERKGVDPIVVQNFIRLFITTNHDVPVTTDDTGRRFIIMRCSDEKIGDNTYFETLFKYMQCPHNIRAIYDYLKAYRYDGINWIKDRPITEQTRVVLAHNTHYLYRYLEALVKEMETKGMDSASMLASTCMAQLELFCLENLKRKDTNVSKDRNTLWRMLKVIPGFTKRIIGKQNVTQYTFSRDELVPFLKAKYLLSEDSEMVVTNFLGNTEGQGDDF